MNNEKNLKERDSYIVKKEYMEFFFKKYREMWDDNHVDDRALFCGIYDQIMEALEVLKYVDNALIWVGFNKQCGEKIEVMNDIINEVNDFEESEMKKAN